ncbi:hypothetical protein [Solidesulfovibrio sp.]|uniref:hypothetical protein n=1 Tax=Solidesulfovibrio sp. TaxID=2910990 RepID=UPI002B1EC1F7|nr:hypothetical protein [Solidesulfovibrio sp.]MEA5090309.1 hypothetical protein [Solidesulfovibrio sp.]HML62959.1 hypothetical protein [Solidesulfovibrio sp.]
MSVVKKILVGAALAALVCLALALAERPAASPAAPGRSVAQTPARADLAEAVFAMVLENAKADGMAFGEPPTLCQACVAAHLGLPGDVVRERCARACALR